MQLPTETGQGSCWVADGKGSYGEGDQKAGDEFGNSARVQERKEHISL